jgi:hypothetical protein
MQFVNTYFVCISNLSDEKNLKVIVFPLFEIFFANLIILHFYPLL